MQQNQRYCAFNSKPGTYVTLSAGESEVCYAGSG